MALDSVNDMASVSTGPRVSELDVRTLLVRLWIYRWFVVLCVLTGMAVFGAYAFLATPIYRSVLVMMPASADRTSISGSLNSALGQAGGLVSLLGVGPGNSDPATEEALAVLRSREFGQRFIEEKNLLPAFFPRKWNARSNTWKNPDDIPSLARGFKYFDNQIRAVSQDKKSGLAVLQIDWRDRNEASEWANELIRKLNSVMRDRAIANADSSLAFLEKELARTTTIETRDAIDHLIEGQEKQRMLANVVTEYAFKVVDRAMPSDADDPIKPKKPLMFALGAILGLGVGMAGIALRTSLRDR